METVQSNNLLQWLGYIWRSTFRKLVYPGLRLSYEGVCDCFLFSLFVMPSYFGVRLGFFDLTAVRLFEVLLLMLIWKKKSRRKMFFDLIFQCSHLIFLAAYFFVIVYTNLFHPSIGTIFYWLMNGFLVFFLVAYLIVVEYGIDGFLKKLRIYTWFLVLVSPLELIIGRPPFSLLDTLGKSNTNMRFGNVRIMGNCTTTNGYAMFLCILLPLICYDIKTRRIDILKNKWLVIMLLLNVFLTGSRLSVGTGILALALCLIQQDKYVLRKILLGIVIVVPVTAALAYVFRDVDFVRSLLCTFFSAFDEIFDTNYAVNFGADATMLYNSSYYRKLLVRETFGGDWLNPWMGRGGNYTFGMYIEGYRIFSCDNFYVGQYITYAYPGLVTWLVMSASFLAVSIWLWFKKKDLLAWAIFSSIVCYFISLWYLDQLQTFPIMFAVFGVIYAMERITRHSEHSSRKISGGR